MKFLDHQFISDPETLSWILLILTTHFVSIALLSEVEDMEPKRKKYAKESWPGRKAAAPTIAPLLF